MSDCLIRPQKLPWQLTGSTVFPVDCIKLSTVLMESVQFATGLLRKQSIINWCDFMPRSAAVTIPIGLLFSNTTTASCVRNNSLATPTPVYASSDVYCLVMSDVMFMVQACLRFIR